MIEVTLLKVVSGDRLLVGFSDGRTGEFDARALLGEDGSLVEPLRDPAYFARAFLEAGAPTWPNGFDIAPQWLHETMADQGLLQMPQTAA